MNSDRPSFIVGSDFEGAEGMFEAPSSDTSNYSEQERLSTINNLEIFPDIRSRFETTMEENGWSLVQDIAEGIYYPDPEEWIRFRTENSRGTKFYPCFVRDTDNEVSFVKFQLSENARALHGLAQEQHIFAAGIPDIIGSPAMLSDSAPAEGRLGYMEFEAISYNEGQVASTEDISLEQCNEVAKKIKTLEDYPIDELPTETYHIPDFLEDKNVSDIIYEKLQIISDRINEVPADWQTSELYTNEWFIKLQKFAQMTPNKKVIVHGDAGKKNILVHRDKKTVSFVDWEMAGIGFIGQDAGKFLNGLSNGSEQRNEFIHRYIRNEDSTVDTERLYGMFGSLILESLVSLSYRMERLPAYLDPKSPEKMASLKQKLFNSFESINRKLEEFSNYQVGSGSMPEQ